MAFKFCCTLKRHQRHKEATYLSHSGEEYLVKYHINARQDLTLFAEWKVDSCVLIMTEVYTHDLKNCIASKGVIVVGGRIATLTLKDVFNTCSATNYDYRCITSVIPYASFQSAPQTSESSRECQNVEPVQLWPVTKQKQDKLSADMKNLLNDDTSDVIVTEGTIEIRAHKLILSARSPVFEKMFQHDLKENMQNRLTISDLTEEALKEFINFIYSGTITMMDMKMVHDLYVVADRYDIKDLSFICSSLLKNVTMDSVLDILVLGNLYGDDVLTKSAMEFIFINYLELHEHESWKRMVTQNPFLLMEVLSFVMQKKS